jgi:DNA sulfur modification protein DndE
MNAFTLEQVLVAGFQTSVDADKKTEQLRSNLGLSAKNRVARLAIGRSLAEPDAPAGSLEKTGKSIKGDVLFGLDSLPLWIALLFTHLRMTNPRAELNLAILQDIVKRHWSRGVALLLEDWEAADEDYHRFVDVLIYKRANLPEFIGGMTPTSSPADMRR